MKNIGGGVCAPKGFRAAGIHCGIRKNKEKKDLAMIAADVPCAAAGVYTTNRVKAAPVWVTMEHLKNGRAQAVIVNSGNANACAPKGREHAQSMAQSAARALDIAPEDVVVASTGVIGQELNIQAILDGVPQLKNELSADGSDAAARAIMTTDLVKKECAVACELCGKTVAIGGITKGSGMIHPNMGTMLCFLTTDAAVSPGMLQKALREAVRVTFNRVSVDGDTSTNDTCVILASGLAGNPEITEEGDDYQAFLQALICVCRSLAREIARDGEGATRLVTCTVSGARDEDMAERLAKSVISSSLVKAAMFGADANWGRVLCAMGYADVEFDPAGVDVAFASCAGSIQVCKDGAGLAFDEEKAKEILTQDEVEILVRLREGDASVTAWGCDLTYEYVKINGDYRT